MNANIPRSSSSLRIGLLSASDHPWDWLSIRSFHLLAHSSLYAQLAPLIATARSNSDLVIFSILKKRCFIIWRI